MSASAREAGSPRSVSDEPLDHEILDHEPFDGIPNEYAPLGDAASTNEALIDGVSAPKAAQQPTLHQNPTRQDHDSSPASVRTEAPEASQPPWKQKRPRGAFTGDVAIAKAPHPTLEQPAQAPKVETESDGPQSHWPEGATVLMSQYASLRLLVSFAAGLDVLAALVVLKPLRKQLLASDH